MMMNNDYASLSSGYSSNMSPAAWCDSFLRPSYSQQPWHKQAGFIEFCHKLSTIV